MSGPNRAKDFDRSAREAMYYVFEVMDEVSGGAMRKGWREATQAEQLAEWDMLPPEGLEKLKQVKGPEWVYSYGAKMERIRKEMEGMRPNAMAV